jgi:hypothetical protein
MSNITAACHFLLCPAIAVALLPAPDVQAAEASSKKGVAITDLDGKVKIEINGQPFTEYFYRDVPRPYFYPVLGPGGLPMTRNWPMKDVPGEEHDHPHHRSLWFTHGEVNGQDFWAETAKSGKIVHDKFVELKSGSDAGVIKSQNKWIAKDGTVVCTDDRTFRVYNSSSGTVFDFEVTIHASNGEVTFGDTKEGSMGIRLAESMRFKQARNQPGEGHIVNSEGVRDGETWGKRAGWVDYYGPVQGRTVGVAIFDHPNNPRHPTWWHVRDYGLFAANPFGLHDFEKQPPHAGNFTIRNGDHATFRYRFYLHDGDEKQAKVAEHYQEYVKTTASEKKPK